MGHTFRNIFFIPVNGNFLVYSPLNGISALINSSGIIELKKMIHLIHNNQGDSKSKFYELARDILQTPEHTPICKTGELSPEFMGIIPTRSCNGACVYCDFGTADAPLKKMSYQMAADATDWYIEMIEKQNRQNVEIHFFGGEPMVASDVIEVVLHRARLLTGMKNLIPYFEISTNGLYSEKKAHFLGNYFNKIILSLDGTEEIQNFQRPLPNSGNSFENAIQTARIISKSQAELCLRACISTKNVDRMEQITEWFCETLHPLAINFEILSPTENTESLDLFPPDPYNFAVNFIKSRVIGKKYGIQVVYASDIGENITTSSCPVGKDAAIFSPDGRISNCYLLPERWQNVKLDLDFGNISDKGIVNIENHKLESIRKMVSDKPRCSRCFCRWTCAGGCHVGTTYPGCSRDYNNFCIQTRIISACTLLEDLGQGALIEKLLDDEVNLKRLALNDSDLLIENGME
jgi:uncharacterized protein